MRGNFEKLLRQSSLNQGLPWSQYGCPGFRNSLTKKQYSFLSSNSVPTLGVWLQCTLHVKKWQDVTSDVTLQMRRPRASEGASVGIQTRAQLRTQTMIVSPSSWSFMDFSAVITDNYLASSCNHMRDSKEKWPKASHSWEPGEAMMINQWCKGLTQAGLWLKSSQRHAFHFQPAV